jgi:hypothetical protein
MNDEKGWALCRKPDHVQVRAREEACPSLIADMMMFFIELVKRKIYFRVKAMKIGLVQACAARSSRQDRQGAKIAKTIF